MFSSYRPAFLMAVATLVVGAAQPVMAAEVTDACSLFTKAEFDAARGTPSYTAPEAVGSDAICGFDGGQVYLYSGPDSQAQWESTFKLFNLRDVDKVAVEGVGDSAYAFYTKPQNQYQRADAFVVFSVGAHTAAVGVQASKGQPGESVHDQALALARLAAGRLE
jgi:4-hydroxyphenylpyruvate dioxygenase-like putative hemolysin